MIRECLERDIDVALYFKGCAYLVRCTNIIELVRDEIDRNFSKRTKQKWLDYVAKHELPNYNHAHP